MSATESARGSDVIRQILVIAAFVFMIIGDAVGLGAFGGTPIQEAQGGSFSPDASYLTPATEAFAIWTPIYLGLAIYVVWQALPSQRTRTRQRSLGWLIALTMVLNGLWLVTVQFLSVWATVACIVLLLAALVVTYLRAVRTHLPSDGAVDGILIDGVTGLHLGWVALATVANVAAALTATVPADWEGAASVLGVIVLVVVAVVALGVSAAGGWRIAPVLSIAWGLAWLAVARLTGDLVDVPIGIAAIVVAAVVLIIPAVARLLRERTLAD
ncbi:tryptophan-rich sensory protein [Microbacterium sp. bgisy207]|uniref:tryptophan-rich sensory protein n=1 Tax=Microbacterium sp. bgisy207 TaxID=3413800 RepID=UPI003EB6C0CF